MIPLEGVAYTRRRGAIRETNQKTHTTRGRAALYSILLTPDKRLESLDRTIEGGPETRRRSRTQSIQAPHHSMWAEGRGSESALATKPRRRPAEEAESSLQVMHRLGGSRILMKH